MGWKNKDTVNISAKNLWKQDIFDVDITEALRDQNSATVHLNPEKLEQLREDGSFPMPVEDGWSKVPFTVNAKNKNTVSVSVFSEVMSTSAAAIMSGLLREDVHAHVYADNAVHGTYDISGKDFSVDNCFEYVRDSNGLDYETSCSLEDDRYHRSHISMSGPVSEMRASVVPGTRQSEMFVQIPVPTKLAPSGIGTLRVPSEKVVMNCELNHDATAHISLGDQSNVYQMSYVDMNGNERVMGMIAGDVAHNVKRLATERNMETNVSMKTVTGMMKAPLPEMSFEDVSMQQFCPEF